jgi:hypothetical protein
LPMAFFKTCARNHLRFGPIIRRWGYLCRAFCADKVTRTILASAPEA